MRIPYLEFIYAKDVKFDKIPVEVLRVYDQSYIMMYKQRVFKMHKPNMHKWNIVKAGDRIIVSVRWVTNSFNDTKVKSFDYTY